jgi:two-component system KDP operon response regulator KdpE
MQHVSDTYKLPKGEGRILVIDSDPGLRNILKLALTDQGYLVQSYGRPTGIIDAVRVIQPELVILDPLFISEGSTDLCEKIRDVIEVPILIISSRSDMQSKTEAFLAGADDYLAKPFNVDELRLRVWAALRRESYHLFKKPNILESGPLVINFDQRLVLLNEQEVRLSPTEYRLLESLARNIDVTISSEVLFAQVWGVELSAAEGQAMLHMNVSRLRKKLGENSRNPSLIINKPGMGYRLAHHPPSYTPSNKAATAFVVAVVRESMSPYRGIVRAVRRLRLAMSGHNQ